MSDRVRLWLAVAAMVLFGRIYQTGVLWPEEGLPLAAAQEILAGAVLYRDVWFDKPPLLAWLYAAFLKAAGYSGYGLRLIGAVYILAVCLAGWSLVRRLDGEPAARWTALFLAFFTAFYHHSATVPLAADLLLLLPHLGVFYLAAAGRPWIAGICAGVAFHLNAKAVLIAAAAALFAGGMAAPVLAGFLIGAGAGLGAVALTGAWREYVEQVWQWGAAYAGTGFSDHPWVLGAERTLNWMGFHAALVVGAAAFFRFGENRRRMTAWLALSFAAAAVGSRFFPRYYFQALPPMAVAAGIGWIRLLGRRFWTVVLAAMLAVPAVRFGKANLWLALGRSWQWHDVAIDADSRRAAAHVVRFSTPADRIFVWGFRPEIYYYSRRRSASQFLESQPLTGVLADRHLERSDPFQPELAAERRRKLAQELIDRPPVVIVDGLGLYNPELGIENFPELRRVLIDYLVVETTRGARIYLDLRRLG